MKLFNKTIGTWQAAAESSFRAVLGRPFDAVNESIEHRINDCRSEALDAAYSAGDTGSREFVADATAFVDCLCAHYTEK